MTASNTDDRNFIRRQRDGMIDWEDDANVAMTIIETIADLEDADPMSLPPLQHHVDVDALSTLFASRTARTDETCYVRFEYAGYDVALHADGLLEVSETSVDRTAPADTSEDY